MLEMPFYFSCLLTRTGMRPYQIYAVKAAKKRVLEANHNGYVFACTGSGKTLTSFKKTPNSFPKTPKSCEKSWECFV